MAIPERRGPFTADEFASIPDDETRHELVAGRLLSEPLPVPRHDRIRRRLERILDRFVSERGLGEVFGEAGFVLARDPDTVRGPDLAFVRAERLSGLDEARFFEGAPDLAVEILSPSNRPGAVRAKVAEYLAAGARLVWVVDPESRTVVAARSTDAPRRFASDGTVDGEEVLPGLTFPVAAIFGEGHGG
jgi:Uma2 family endonuclease